MLFFIFVLCLSFHPATISGGILPMEPTTTDKPMTTDSPTMTDKPMTTDSPTTTDKPMTTDSPTTTDKPMTTDAAEGQTDDKACTETPDMGESTARTDPVTHRKVYDLVYIVDQSGSINEEQDGFDLEKKFLNIFTEKFSIRPGFSQTSFIKFSIESTVEWNFDNFKNQDSAGVVKRITDVDYAGGGTAIAPDEEQTNPEVVAKELRDMKVEIFVIGIGSGVDKKQLNAIAGDPKRVYQTELDKLPKIADEIIKLITSK